MSYNAPLSYVSGNWTVSSQTTDSDVVGKTLTVSNLTFATDFAKTEETATEARLANVTGSALGTMETLRYAKTDVKNVYTGTTVGASNQMPVKAGVRSLIEINTLVKATNSVSGEEYLVPLRAWTCVQIPVASFISSAAMEYAVGRLFGATFNSDVVTISREEEVVRGSLLPR